MNIDENGKVTLVERSDKERAEYSERKLSEYLIIGNRLSDENEHLSIENERLKARIADAKSTLIALERFVELAQYHAKDVARMKDVPDDLRGMLNIVRHALTTQHPDSASSAL